MAAERKVCDRKEKAEDNPGPSKSLKRKRGGNQSSEGSLEKSRNIVDFCGLQNQGATCYLNSVLQILYMTPKFKEAVLSDKNPDGRAVLGQLQKLFDCLESKDESIISTEGISNSLKIYDVWEQGDAVEYFQKILNAVGTASEVYRGTMVNTTTCLDTHHSGDNSSLLQENFITIPISMGDAKGLFSVRKGLKEFSEPIQLDGKYCCTCERKTKTASKYTIHGCPTILSLHLKRFDLDYDNYVKNNCPVDIPTTLNIEANKYSLYGILNHFGSIHWGHYTAWLKNENEKWYNCDDSHVSVMDIQEHEPRRSHSAYLLMYEREEEDDTSNVSPNPSSASEPKPTTSPITPCEVAQSTTGHAIRECSHIKEFLSSCCLWTVGLSLGGVIITGIVIVIWFLQEKST